MVQSFFVLSASAGTAAYYLGTAGLDSVANSSTVGREASSG
ncbi:hypothetical protein [Scytonema sp. PRP1]